MIHYEPIESIEQAHKWMKQCPEGGAVSLQTLDPFLHWNKIRLHHLYLESGNFPFIHLNLPTEKLEGLSERRSFDKLNHQQNTEAYLALAGLLNIEVGAFLKTIRLEAVEQYQLQSYLEDYQHELSSYLLKKTLVDLDLVLKKMVSNDPEGSLIELEKKVIKYRGELEGHLDVIRSILEKLYHSLGKSRLKELVTLYLTLISDAFGEKRVEALGKLAQAFKIPVYHHFNA